MKKIKINIKNAKFGSGFNIKSGTDKLFLDSKDDVLKYIEEQKNCDYADVIVEDETKTFLFD